LQLQAHVIDAQFVQPLARFCGKTHADNPTVMLAALPVILGSQLLLSFLNYDVRNIPQIPLQKRL